MSYRWYAAGAGPTPHTRLWLQCAYWCIPSTMLNWCEAASCAESCRCVEKREACLRCGRLLFFGRRLSCCLAVLQMQVQLQATQQPAYSQQLLLLLRWVGLLVL